MIFDTPAHARRYDRIGIAVEPASGGVIHVIASDDTDAQPGLLGYVALSAAHDVT